MQCIDSLTSQDLKGKRVLVRAGLDLPVEQGEVGDTFRVQRAIPTLKYLADVGAKIIILSHIGREVTETNESVHRALTHFVRASYVPDLFGHTARNVIQGMDDGDMLLLENVRQFYDREKSNDPAFAEELASLGEIYVNDAFSNSHRAHATMVGIPKLLPHYAGLLLRDEVRELSKSRTPEHPSFAIIGGAKFETKIPVITRLLETYDYVFITGALANDVFKARGFPVGRSVVSDTPPSESVLSHHGFVAPIDVTIEDEAGHPKVKKPGDVLPGDKIVDIGPDTLAMIGPHIAQAKSIIWNGPTGLYEDGYISFTHALAELVRHRVTEGAHSVIGGNNTIAAVHSSGISENELGFLSTGGGAMLEYLAQGTLPAIEALN